MPLQIPASEGALGPNSKQMVYEAIRRIARMAASDKVKIVVSAPLVGGGDLTEDLNLSISITPANSGGAVALQATTPGTEQTGHAHLSGTILSGALGSGYIAISGGYSGAIASFTNTTASKAAIWGASPLSAINAGTAVIVGEDTTAMAADVGAGILLRGKYKADGTTGGFGGIKAGKANATEANLDGYLDLYSRNHAGGILSRLRIDKDGGVVLAMQGALATDATGGFTHLPSCAGAPSGTPTTYSGNIPVVYDSTNDRLRAFNAGNWATVGGSGSPATGWIRPDPGFSVGSSYERLAGVFNSRVVQLVALKTFSVTHANAISTPPEGWSWLNSGNLTSADTNTSLANALHIVHNTSSTDNYYSTTNSAPRLYRARDATGQQFEIVCRMKLSSHSSNWWAGMNVYDSQNANYFIKIALKSATQNQVCLFQNINGTSTALGTANLTGQQANTDGIWVRLVCAATGATGYYNTTNTSTMPWTWTYLDSCSGIWKSPGVPLGVGFDFVRDGTGSTGTVSADVMHFYETPVNTLMGNSFANNQPCAMAWDDSSPVLTLVSGFDLGSAAAIISDANVQACLTEVTNWRWFDAATWTWSVTRGNSAPVTPGSYAAPGSVTVGGSGRYVSIAAKAASSGRIQPGSINVERLAIPFTP